MGFPAKKMLTLWRPTLAATYSQRHVSAETSLTFTDAVFLLPDGSRMITSGVPFPASVGFDDNQNLKESNQIRK
jgi:hypothetical protein